jgi:hypothetical protein
MKTYAVFGCTLGLALIAGSASAQMLPGTPPAGTDFTVNIGAIELPPGAGEVSYYHLPALVSPGFVVVIDDPTMDPMNPGNWSDVLFFRPNQRVYQLTFASDPALEQGFADTDLMRIFGVTSSQINMDPNGTQYVTEVGPPTPYVPDSTRTTAYNIFSDLEGGGGGIRAPTNPEPSSLTLLGIGALGLIGYVWRRLQRAA